MISTELADYLLLTSLHTWDKLRISTAKVSYAQVRITHVKLIKVVRSKIAHYGRLFGLPTA